MNDGSVCIEFLRSVTTIIGKLLDQILITVSKLILGAVSEGKRFRREVLQQILQQPVRQTVFVRPSTVAEDAGHFFSVGFFDFLECSYDRSAYILGDLPHIIPMMSLRDDECVQFFFGIEIDVIAVFGNSLRFLHHTHRRSV